LLLAMLPGRTCAALIISRGDMMAFLDHPISAGRLAVALIILALPPTIRKGRDEVFVA
jgi:putative tricarboxylic transport membrane protein